MSAYEAADNGFGDEGYPPPVNSAWFGGAPGVPALPGDGAPANGHEFAPAAGYGAAPATGAGFGTAPGGFSAAIGTAFADAGFGAMPTGGGDFGGASGAGYGGANGGGFGSGVSDANGAGFDAANGAGAGFGGANGSGSGSASSPGFGASNSNGTSTGSTSGRTALPDYPASSPNAVAYTDPGFGRQDFSAPPATRHAADPTSSRALLPALAHPGPPRPGPAGDVLRLVAVTAGLGQPSTARILADRLAEAARVRVGERGRQVLVEVLELRDLALDIAGAMVAGFPGAKLRAALDAVEGADGLIAVSPIYTASYSGLFKSFFDVLDKDALTGKPTLIAATGGTARHSLALDHALRPMFAYLRAFMVPTAVFAASEDWASTGENSLNERISRAGTELGDLMAGTPAAARRRRDEFEDVVPFEQRMAALRSGI